MNCRKTEPLLLAERNGGLTAGQSTALAQHVATCPACRRMSIRLADTLAVFRTDAANVPIPDMDREWSILRAQLHQPAPRAARRHPLAPVIWFGTSLAAAAALTFAYLGRQSRPTAIIAPDNQVAQAEFVEAGDAQAATMVYVDKESGWLVVWATDSAAKNSG